MDIVIGNGNVGVDYRDIVSSGECFWVEDRLVYTIANLGIKLGTRSQDVTTRSKNQNTGQSIGSGTQGSGLKLSSSIGKYLTKYRRVHPTYM